MSFAKKTSQNKLYSAKATYILKEPTNHSHISIRPVTHKNESRHMMWLLCDSWRDSFSCVTGLTHISDVIDLICFTHLNESRDLRVIHTCQSSDRTCSFTLLSHETYSDVWNVSVIWHDLFIHTPKSRDLFRCVKRVSHLTWLVWTVSFIWHGVFIHRSAITTREWSSDGIHIWWMTFIYDGWCCYNAWCHSSYHSYMMNDGIHIYGIHRYE